MTTNECSLNDEDQTLVFAFLNQELAVRAALRKHDKAAEHVQIPELIRLAEVVYWENFRLKVLYQRIIKRKISSEEIQNLRREMAKQRFIKSNIDWSTDRITT